MYHIHKDASGSFQELVHSSDVKFGQLSRLTVEPQAVRGGHYHTHKEEWFCCLHGKCNIVVENVKDGARRVLSLKDTHRKFVLIKPYENHTVLNLGSSKICELLVIASEEYNPENPDTFEVE